MCRCVLCMRFIAVAGGGDVRRIFALMRTFVALNCIFTQTVSMSLGLGKDYYQNRQKTIPIIICVHTVGKITVSQCRHTAFITDILITVLYTLFCSKWSNLFSRHQFSDHCRIFTPENFGICSKDTMMAKRLHPFLDEAIAYSQTNSVHSLSGLHLHFVIVFLVHQFVMDSNIYILTQADTRKI